MSDTIKPKIRYSQYFKPSCSLQGPDSLIIIELEYVHPQLLSMLLASIDYLVESANAGELC